jgi:hypothetical protein
MNQIIELDCPPMQPRPDTYISGVIKDTGLPERKPSSCCFGEWTWDYSDISAVEWQRVLPIIEQRIISLYESKCIRYGAWS